MEIDKLSLAIQQAGYNPFGISGTSEQDAMKLAERNGISVEEAQSILKEAEKQAQELDNLFNQTSMVEMLNEKDEEELVAFDDTDFDKFLNQIPAEQKMQDLLNKQQYVNPNMAINEANNASNNMFSQGENPFLRNRF